MKQFAVIMLMTLIGGVLLAAGAILFAVFLHRPGLFIGALIGGALGTYLNVRIVSRLGFITYSRHTISGTAVGTIAAFIVAAANLDSPVICLAAPLLIGIGALIGERWF